MSNLPTVTSAIPRDLRNFVDRLRDMINGNSSARLVSANDLVDAGIANLSSTGNLSAAIQPTVNYGTPPAPTNVQAGAAIQNVIVTWDAPSYTGHAYAEVWGADTNDIGTAVVLGLAPGAIYTDPLGPGKTRYYWVRFVNIQDTTGPYNALNGVAATTGTDVAYLLSTLAGQISTSQLTTGFNTRLNGIETNATAIATESTTRANADSSINAKYTVKIDNAGHISGFGLISDANNASPYASFGVRANQFFIAPPAVVQATAPSTGLYKGYVWVDSSVTPNVTKYYTGAGWSTTPQALPFVVQASSTTVNGVAVAAGVYIDSAYIENGTITNAKIGNAAIDDAKIANLSASKINAGTIGADYITAAVVNAKVTNIDAAVIQTGFIDAARINSASIANANIAAAQITSGTIDAARINSASIANANIGAAQITSGTIDAARITNASIANAVVSGSFTFALDSNNYLIIDGPNQRIEVWAGGARRVVLGKL